VIKDGDRILAGLMRRAAAGALAFWIVLLLGVQIARATELVPAVGWMRLKDNSESKSFASLALRSDLLPAVQAEVAAGYRSEDRFADQLHVKMWPVTASLWLTPIPVIYAGGGVGWYHTTLDYASNLPFADETREEFGVHLGGGFKVPVVPTAAVDLGGRYVMMRDQESHLIPQRFDPDFWVTTLGLAIRF